jgi:hypothetical protein
LLTLIVRGSERRQPRERFAPTFSDFHQQVPVRPESRTKRCIGSDRSYDESVRGRSRTIAAALKASRLDLVARNRSNASFNKAGILQKGEAADPRGMSSAFSVWLIRARPLQ